MHARTTYPELHVEDEAFIRAVTDRLGEEPSLAELSALHGDDLFLACACGLGDRAAIHEFERRFLGPTAIAAITRVTSAPAVVAEAKQLLRVKLFVQDGVSLPKILNYSGRGPLQAWVRTAAVRTALNLVSRQPPDTAGVEPSEPPIWWPRLSSAPTSRVYPRVGFSVAIRITSCSVSTATVGRSTRRTPRDLCFAASARASQRSTARPACRR
jgi:hypothetical protein